MGIPVEMPTFVFWDNQYVLAYTSMPHSTLKKTSSIIAFHFFQRRISIYEWQTTNINTHLNPLDMCTKSLSGEEKRAIFNSYLLHYVDFYVDK